MVRRIVELKDCMAGYGTVGAPKSPLRDPASSGRDALAIMLLLLILTIASYSAVPRFGFVDYDDPSYVGDNQNVSGGLTATNIAWAFTSFHASNWQPLTWLSLQLDTTLFGSRPSGYHVMNVILHALASVLLFLALHRMTGRCWTSALVAALFAVHPAHVESVAWISERKDVLSAVFWMLTLLLYAAYARQPSRLRHLFVCGAFVLGILAKPMLVTLPFVLLLVDHWPLQRWMPDEPHAWPSLLRLAREKSPLILMALASCVITVVAQHAGGALRDVEMVPLSLRLKLALTAYVKYLGILFFPTQLSAFRPITDIPWYHALGAALVLGAVSAVCWRAARTRPYLATGWLWYLLTLLPVIGLVQVGDQSVADRYTYLPSIGLFLGVVWFVAEVSSQLPHGRIAATLISIMVLVILLPVTQRQARHWRSREALWEHALEITPDNLYAITNLSADYLEDGRFDEAQDLLNRGMAYSAACDAPRCSYLRGALFQNIGSMYIRNRHWKEAIEALSESLRLKPNEPRVRLQLIRSWLSLGQPKPAALNLLELLNEGFVLPPAEGEGQVWVQFARGIADIGGVDEALQILKKMAENYASAGLLSSATAAAVTSLEIAVAKRPERVSESRQLVVYYESLQR